MLKYIYIFLITSHYNDFRGFSFTVFFLWQFLYFFNGRKYFSFRFFIIFLLRRQFIFNKVSYEITVFHFSLYPPHQNPVALLIFSLLPKYGRKSIVFWTIFQNWFFSIQNPPFSEIGVHACMNVRNISLLIILLIYKKAKSLVILSCMLWRYYLKPELNKM